VLGHFDRRQASKLQHARIPPKHRRRGTELQEAFYAAAASHLRWSISAMKLNRISLESPCTSIGVFLNLRPTTTGGRMEASAVLAYGVLNHEIQWFLNFNSRSGPARGPPSPRNQAAGWTIGGSGNGSAHRSTIPMPLPFPTFGLQTSPPRLLSA
jgi:hypothetical protein